MNKNLIFNIALIIICVLIIITLADNIITFLNPAPPYPVIDVAKVVKQINDAGLTPQKAMWYKKL